jgi:Zn-dependent M28 family amino/carboxypeptidase
MRVFVPLIAVALAASACASRVPEATSPYLPAMRSVDEALAEISPARIRADVDRLAAFGTRHTLSATEGDRGIGAARRWLLGEFTKIAAESGRTDADAMQVRLESHRQPPAPRIPAETEIVNVEAVLPGARPGAAERRIYFVAHYDSRATVDTDATSDAPGANDDGSGVAALLEVARVLSTRRFDATIVFLAVAGEEEGLYGSKLHAAAARAKGLEIGAVLSDDIVGDPSGPDGASSRDAIRVFSEGIPRAASADEVKRLAALGGESDSRSRELARFVAEVAALHRTRVQPQLVFRSDRFLRGGDHLSFLDQGWPAVRFTDVHEKYDRQHQDVRVEDGHRFGDLPEFVDADYLADVARLNAAALVHLANAPRPPSDARIVAAELTTSTTLRWNRSPDAGVAGYEILWRATTSASWEHVSDAGNVEETTLPVSKDDFLFGVRAYDADGWRGVPVFPTAARQ